MLGDTGRPGPAFTTALRDINYFDHIVFAILDRTPATPVYRAFANQGKTA